MDLHILTLQILRCASFSLIVFRHTQCLTLTLSNSDILENTDVHLRCWNEDTLLAPVRWTRKTPIQQAIMSFANNICSVNPGFLQDSSAYSYNCTDGKTFIVTIKSISREINGQIWLCDFGTSLNASNEKTIYVNVPVSKSIISPNSKLITASEHSIISLQCTTSECRPEPTFTWYKDNSLLTDGDELIMSQSGNAVSSATTIRTYTNHFSITLTRDLNGWYIFCSAGNYNGGSVPSDKILLNVTFPPDRPSIGDLVNGSEVKSIQGEHIDLECSITGGNPRPTLQWNRNNESPMNIIGNKVTMAISWQAVGRDPVELICRSLHPNRNDSVNVKIDILYPPGFPEITMKMPNGTYVHVNNELNVIEGQQFKLDCSAKSNPPVSLYKWNELMPTNWSIFDFEKYSRSTKSISCRVSNEMKTSDSRPTVTGTNVTRLVVSVLYPPIVNKMTDRTVEEGADIVYKCDFVPGNPSVTNVTWSWNGTTWNDRLLTISNVTRHQAGVYRCDVRNLMVSSDGTTEYGNTSGEFNLTVQLTPIDEKSDPGPGPSSSASLVVAGAVGGTGGVAFLVAVFIIVVVFKKRRQKKKQDGTGQLVNLNKKTEGYMELIPNDHEQSSSQPGRQQTRIEDTHGLQELDDYDENLKTDYGVYGNAPDMIKKIERVDVVELVPYLTDKTAEFFGADYAKLPHGLTKSYEFSQRPENIALNRYHGIYPYDHSRVKIPSMPDYFINACYIDGYKNKKAYIASLGPLSRTSNRFVMFWQMVWSEKSDVIVMLTKLTEPSGVKCDQYWPKDGTSEAYGEVTVTSAGEEVYSDYVVRKFSLLKGGQKRNLKHFHFMAWPDKSIPEDVTCILEFRRSVRANHSSGPLIVHCSAGIGRTGTLIAIDILVEEGQKKGSVNVFECVKKMRDQRINMVQTLDQYFYVYKALANALVFDNEAITAEKIHKYVETSKPNRFSDMFKTFNLSVESENTIENNSRNANKILKEKNRAGSDIPGDAHRVRLFLNRGMEDSDYINAVYLNSFTVADHFITAQSPLQKCVEDFLCLIYQENCCCVVSMDGEQARQSSGSYVPPDNSNFTAGSYSVQCSRLDTKETYIVRKLKIEINGQIKGAEKVVYHFQFLGWLDGNKVPNDPLQFVEFTEDVERFACQFGTEGSHVLVHCSNAFERSCLFCAVVAMIEKIKHEKEVCIQNTLRQIRTRRKLAIPTLEQFKFCYQAVDAIVTKEKAGTNNAENSYMNVTMT